MQGFHPKFKDFPDFILGITHEIWEEKQVETLYHYYSDDIPVRSPSSLVIGNKAVINATHETLSEFPDRQLLGEDVIWSGSPEEGMLSSHRIFSTATHLGAGGFGMPTGRKLRYRVIADCHAIANQINDEWLVRDFGGIVHQLGFHSKEFALQQIRDEGGIASCNKPFNADMDIKGPYLGTGNDNEWGILFSEILTSIMSGKSDIIQRRYDRSGKGFYPENRIAIGFSEIEAFWMSFRNSFPSATFAIHHKIGREDPFLPPRAAVRWSLSGKHDGAGRFGNPTGTDIYVMGISHAEFGPWGLRNEYTLFDDVAIWKQIHIHKGRE